MAKHSVQKQFLSAVRAAWKTQLPMFTPVDLVEVPKRPKGTNYRCDKYLGERGACYFVSFEFSDRRKGEFTLSITVSPSADRSVLDVGVTAPISPTTFGSFHVSKFLSRRAHTWALADADAATVESLKRIGVDPATVVGPPLVTLWKPSSFAQPPEVIVDEVLKDVTQRLREDVLPRLQIV